MVAKRKWKSPELTIAITAELVERAVKASSNACLIADGIKKEYPHLSNISVDMATIRVTDRKKGERYVYLTTPPAQHCLLAFDQGWPNPTDTLVIKRAVKIEPIKRSRGELVSRAERLASLEAKEASGEPLDRREKQSLVMMRKWPERPATVGPVEVGRDAHNGIVVRGGSRMPKSGNPNLLAGRDRHFGAKLADPGLVFQEAVDAAVAQHLAVAGARVAVAEPPAE